MPWRIEERDSRYCVVKEDDDTTEACHDTRAEALAHQRALYAAEDEMAGRSVGVVDTKGVGLIDVAIKALPDDDDSGEFEAVLSATTVDRDGEVIDARAFEPLPDHIPIDIDHGLTVATTVGSGRPYYEGDVLKFKGRFSSIPRAQEVRTLVREGHIRKMSVAFPRRSAVREYDGKDGKQHVRKAELINAAIVAVPSNREASILAAKAGARNSKNDMERLQRIHDDCAALGASCGLVLNSYGVTTTLDVTTDKSTDNSPEDAAAAPAAAAPPAEVSVAMARLQAARAAALLL